MVNVCDDWGNGELILQGHVCMLYFKLRQLVYITRLQSQHKNSFLVNGYYVSG